MADIDCVVTDRARAHRVLNDAYRMAQALMADGRRVRIRVGEYEVDRTLAQNRYYWGVVLPTISQQARIEGQRWVADAWHELMRRQFLGVEVKRVTVAGRRKKLVNRRLRSTSDLKVRAFGNYLDQVQAFASSDLGVMFPVGAWQHWGDDLVEMVEAPALDHTA